MASPRETPVAPPGTFPTLDELADRLGFICVNLDFIDHINRLRGHYGAGWSDVVAATTVPMSRFVQYCDTAAREWRDLQHRLEFTPRQE